MRLLLRRVRFWKALSALALVVACAWWLAPKVAPVVGMGDKPWPRQEVARVLGDEFLSSRYPASVSTAPAADADRGTQLNVEYTLDFELQETMEKLFQSYRPDYGAFAAVDAETGRVLSLVSYGKSAHSYGHLALQARFPAASIFKIITAAAALDSKLMQPDTVIPFDGASHTLYRRNVRETRYNRWTRYVTLEQAFAKSINTVFGKVGVFHVGSNLLQDYAARFGFNSQLDTDLPAQAGSTGSPKDDWEIAEMASGYNRDSSLSPLHGALIGGTIANDGVFVPPYVVEKLTDGKGKLLYSGTPEAGTRAISPEGAEELRELMQATVASGTSRQSFRKLRGLRRIDELEVGGKTGSLTGGEPRGKVDWFVGYARIPSPDIQKNPNGIRIGIAALTVNVKKWTVKSSWLAGRFVELYHSRLPKRLEMAAGQGGENREPASSKRN
jgi:cell division protein FtsI/penicillin-binding protein 2